MWNSMVLSGLPLRARAATDKIVNMHKSASPAMTSTISLRLYFMNSAVNRIRTAILSQDKHKQEYKQEKQSDREELRLTMKPARQSRRPSVTVMTKRRRLPAGRQDEFISAEPTPAA